MPKQIAVNEELVRSFTMVDGDLKLVLKEIGVTSPPDEELQVCSFRMTNCQSGVEMGTLNLRVGYTQNIVRYRGNIGYTVFESYRGQNYSARSCKLLVPLLKQIQLSPIWITCNVDNRPSKRSIEKLGATFVEVLSIPNSYQFIQFYPPEAQKKLRFRWDVV